MFKGRPEFQPVATCSSSQGLKRNADYAPTEDAPKKKSRKDDYRHDLLEMKKQNLLHQQRYREDLLSCVKGIVGALRDRSNGEHLTMSSRAC